MAKKPLRMPIFTGFSQVLFMLSVDKLQDITGFNVQQYNHYIILIDIISWDLLIDVPALTNTIRSAIRSIGVCMIHTPFKLQVSCLTYQLDNLGFVYSFNLKFLSHQLSA